MVHTISTAKYIDGIKETHSQAMKFSPCALYPLLFKTQIPVKNGSGSFQAAGSVAEPFLRSHFKSYGRCGVIFYMTSIHSWKSEITNTCTRDVIMQSGIKDGVCMLC